MYKKLKGFDGLTLNEDRRRKKKKSKYQKRKDIAIKKEEYVEIDYTLDGSVKQLFLNLTKMQIPFDYEEKLESFFPNMEKDSHGNYFKKIGESETMFCGHLDTYCREYKRVWHILKDNMIKTDGTTTLGGDDKAGILLMIKMMEANIPGLYYFFRGEEGVTSPTGTWGSKQALRTYEDLFKKYKKCVAFDRRGNDSIITEQMYQDCCSDEFSEALKKEFDKNGLSYKKDDTGMWCDSGVFMKTIPEVTNISVGFNKEHTFNEYQDIKHLEELVEVVKKIDWEKLPVKRDPTKETYKIGRYSYFDDSWGGSAYYHGSSTRTKPSIYTRDYSHKKSKKERDFVTMDDMFFHVLDILYDFGYRCINRDEFEELQIMYFLDDESDDFFGLRIVDFEIFISEDDELKEFVNIGDVRDFEKYVKTGVNPNLIEDERDKKYDTFDDYVEKHDKKEKKEDKKYTELQNETFLDFTKKYPDIVKDVMQYILKTNEVGLSGNLWLKIDKKMDYEKYPVDYKEHGTNITPDDLSMWVSDNWVEVNTILSDSNYFKKDKDNTNQDKIKNIKKNNPFLSQLSDNKINFNKFHYDEYILFSKIVNDQKILTMLVLKDIEINEEIEVRSSTTKHIWEVLTRFDFKRTDIKPLTAYPENFVKWAYYYKDEINNFYEI